jgi:DNA-binding beta-propeller fold protein YncE
MNFRKVLLFAIAPLLCLGRPAFPQINGVEVGAGATAQVFGGKSPSVQVTDAEGKMLASIPIEKGPGRFIYSESANTLYVVHNEKRAEHFISAVNLTTQRVDKQIKVGTGVAVDVFLSPGGHRLFCYTASKRMPKTAMGMLPDYYDTNNLKPPFEPVVSVIDTASNNLIATYTWLDGFLAGLPPKHNHWAFKNQFLAASDRGEFIVISEAYWHKPIRKQFVVFSGQSPHPAFMIDTTGRMVGSMLSLDEKLLFVADEGDKNTAGSVIVVDLEKGTAVQRPLTDHPTRLFRLGSKQEPWILGKPGDALPF